MAWACEAPPRDWAGPPGLSVRADGPVAVVHPGAVSGQAGQLGKELCDYLERLGGFRPTQVSGVESGGALPSADQFPVVIQLAVEDATGTEALATPGAYRLESEAGPEAQRIYRIRAATPQALAYGTYAFLERLGVRFFHPHQELVPSRSALYLPVELGETKVPALESRGWHVHNLHPLEYTPLLLEPADSHLMLARELVRWLLKTRQNLISFYLLDTVDLVAWVPYMTALVEEAHAWDIRVAVNVMLWSGSSLQHAFTLVEDTADWQDEMDTRVDTLMQVPWDALWFGFGEFFASGAQETLDWMNHLVEVVDARYPGVEVGAEIHVGDYPETRIDYQGETLLYYFLPRYADPRLSVLVHSVMHYTLYDPAHGVYGHADFSEHRQFLLGEVDRRKTYYFPESAYWCTFDIDVGLFLPVYVDSRIREVERLMADVEAQGSRLAGAQLFSSGHEWGYWLTDYLYARALFEGPVGLDDHLGHVSGAFGEAGPSLGAALRELIDAQKRWFLEENLIPYLAARDLYDDLGDAMHIVTHPRPAYPLAGLASLSASERAALETTDLVSLGEMEERFGDLADRLERARSRAPEEARPWLAELTDGTRMLALRSGYVRALYRAVLRGLESGLGLESASAARALGDAAELRKAAQSLVWDREPRYRYPLPLYVGRYENATIYPWGYLAQLHDLCFWERDRQMAETLLREGQPPDFTALPSCID